MGSLERGVEREHIDNLRKQLELLECKSPDEQSIGLTWDQERPWLAVVTLRSGGKNALSGRMISQLTELLDQLEGAQGKLRGLLIKGHGGTFCSGSDLVSVRQSANQAAGLALAQVMQYNLGRLQRLPAVSVAFVEGWALGGGAELAMGADLRLMSGSAKIGFVHAKVGVCCGWGGGSRLVELLNPARALDLLASGRLVAAQEALELGLVNGLAANEREALDYLASRAQAPPSTLAALKAMLAAARLLAPGEALRAEAHLFASTWGKRPHLEALESNIKHNRPPPVTDARTTDAR